MTPYYERDGITIYHEDCREILPTLESVDLLLTDPPYGVNLGKHKASNDLRRKHINKKSYKNYEDTPENFSSVVVPVVRAGVALAERAAVFGTAPSMFEFPPADVVGGIYLPSAVGRNRWGFSSLSHVLFYGTSPIIRNGCVATAIRSTDTASANGHPCPKPLSWMRWLVKIASKEGELLLDPFMGSGTTLRAAKDLGRCAIGIEIEERYCEIAANRLAQGVLF